MRVCLQRVTQAKVEAAVEKADGWDWQLCGRIGSGFLALVGVTSTDTDKDAAVLADKVVNLRVFADVAGKLNLSLLDIKAQVLAVSQFTLYADCRKGRRPSFSSAAPPEQALALYNAFINYLRAAGIAVETGRFGAHMRIELVNDGPVTILLESQNGNLI